MRFLSYALLGVGLITPSLAQARPVSYPDGWTLMLMNDGAKNSVHAHYSPTARTSLGYRFEYRRDQALTLNAVQVNHLLKRWNKPDSQANLYLKSGLGAAYGHAGEFDGKTDAAGFIGFAVDWEDRRYFVAYENRYTEAGELDGFFRQSAQVGWAPYQGDYGALHTWFMLRVDHLPGAQDNFAVTPLVRLFKGVHLLEAGASQRGEVLFNYIFRH